MSEFLRDLPWLIAAWLALNALFVALMSCGRDSTKT